MVNCVWQNIEKWDRENGYSHLKNTISSNSIDIQVNMDELKDHDPRLPPQLAEIATIHFVSFMVGKHSELLSDYFVKELGRCRDKKEVECFQQNSIPKVTVPGMIINFYKTTLRNQISHSNKISNWKWW